MKTQEHKKAKEDQWRASPAGKSSIGESAIKYRNSVGGRMKIKELADKRSEKRRQIAAEKSGVAAVEPGQYDASAVQRTLTIWGGL